MPAAIDLHGRRYPVFAKPADTNEASMFTAGAERPAVVGLHICNNTNNIAHATVQFYSAIDDVDYDILNNHPVQSYDTYFLWETFYPMREGDIIKITSDTGNALTFCIIVVEIGSALQNRGSRGS